MNGSAARGATQPYANLLYQTNEGELSSPPACGRTALSPPVILPRTYHQVRRFGQLYHHDRIFRQLYHHVKMFGHLYHRVGMFGQLTETSLTQWQIIHSFHKVVPMYRKYLFDV